MQFKHNIVLAVTAIFLAVSCITVDKTLGDDFISSNQNLPVQTAMLDLPVEVKSSQPLQGFSGGESVFGAIRTPEYGLVQFSTMADICPNMSGWDFGKNPVVKEVYFLAPISGTYVAQDGQEGIPQIVTLHRTYKRVDSTVVLNNSITPADYDPVPLNVTENIYFGGDSLKIHLKKSFAETILASSQEERDSLNLFVENFKGLILKSSSPEEGVYGGRENTLSFGSGAIYIRLDYQPTYEEGLSRRDTIFTLSWGYNYCVNISEYESDKMQTDQPGEKLAIEGCGGLKPYINKDALKDAIDNWKTEMGYNDKYVLISKGALVFPFEIPEDLDMTKYPSTMYPCHQVHDTTYNAEFFYPLGDIYVEGYSLGNLDRSLCQYVMDIPSYIQDFVTKEKSELDDTYNMWIMPTFATTESDMYGTSSTTTYSINCTTYYTGHINGPTADKKPKLWLVYSVMDE